MSHSQNAKNGDNGCVNVTYEARAQPIDNKKQPKSQTIFNINSLFFAFCGPSKYRASQKGMYVFKFGDKVRQVAPTSHSRKIQGQFSQPRTSHLVKLWKSEVHHQRERSREKTDRTDSGRSAGMKLTANCARDTKWRKFSLTVGTAAAVGPRGTFWIRVTPLIKILSTFREILPGESVYICTCTWIRGSF